MGRAVAGGFSKLVRRSSRELSRFDDGSWAEENNVRHRVQANHARTEEWAGRIGSCFLIQDFDSHRNNSPIEHEPKTPLKKLGALFSDTNPSS
jgi:hypothetical protein